MTPNGPPFAAVRVYEKAQWMGAIFNRWMVAEDVPHRTDCLLPRYVDGIGGVRCRKCDNCERLRGRQWYARTLKEVSTAPKAWFLTLTYREFPTWDGVKTSIQKFLKRLRRSLSATARVRYMSVIEAGARHGRLHGHMILTCSSSVTKRQIERAYDDGFSRVTLADRGAMSYICKYVGKTLKDTRRRASERSRLVRASNGWGKGWQGDGTCPF